MSRMSSFIVVEGPDGSGKTTQSKRLAEALGMKWRCFPDRSTPIGKLIDAYLKGEWVAHATDEAEYATPPSSALIFQGLMLANRTEVLDQLALDVRTRGLVLDRYWQSGYAYGARDGISKSYLIQMHSGLPKPDISILLDVDAEVAVERLRGRGVSERYDSVDDLREVIQNYRELWLERMRIEPGRWYIASGAGDVEQVAATINAVIERTQK